MLKYDGLIFQNELILIKQMHKKSVTFVHLTFVHKKSVTFKYKSYRCNGCHNLMEKAMDSTDTPIVF